MRTDNFTEFELPKGLEKFSFKQLRFLSWMFLIGSLLISTSTLVNWYSKQIPQQAIEQTSSTVTGTPEAKTGRDKAVKTLSSPSLPSQEKSDNTQADMPTPMGDVKRGSYNTIRRENSPVVEEFGLFYQKSNLTYKYLTQNSDNIYVLAEAHHMSVAEILELNPHVTEDEGLIPGIALELRPWRMKRIVAGDRLRRLDEIYHCGVRSLKIANSPRTVPRRGQIWIIPYPGIGSND